MGPEDDLLRIIGNVYDAALDPDLWDRTLVDIADRMGANGNAFFVFDKKNVMAALSRYSRLPDGLKPEYEGHYLRICPRYAYGVRAPEGTIFSDRHCIGDQRMDKLEYYDFLGKHGLKHFCGLTLLNNDDWFSAIAVQRSPRQGSFPQSAPDFLRPLFPHLRRATQISLNLGRLSNERRDGLEALNFLATGVILLNSECRVVLVNRAAEAIIVNPDGLRVINGALVADKTAERKRLDVLLHGAVRSGSTRGLHPGGALALSRPSRRRPLSVLVAPLGRLAADQGLGPGRGGAAAVVFVSDPEARQETPADVLMRLYGLTPAEARLAEAMAGGGPLTEAAERLGIGRETARSQLKQVFAKTGTRRQAELVRLMLSSSAGLSVSAG